MLMFGLKFTNSVSFIYFKNAIENKKLLYNYMASPNPILRLKVPGLQYITHWTTTLPSTQSTSTFTSREPTMHENSKALGWWVDGWVDGRDGLRIAYTNPKTLARALNLFPNLLGPWITSGV